MEYRHAISTRGEHGRDQGGAPQVTTHTHAPLARSTHAQPFPQLHRIHVYVNYATLNGSGNALWWHSRTLLVGRRYKTKMCKTARERMERLTQARLKGDIKGHVTDVVVAIGRAV